MHTNKEMLNAAEKVVPMHVIGHKASGKNPNAVDASNGPFSGNNMNQVGSGPAALLYSLSNELIAIYSDVQALYNEMSTLETKVQKTTADAGFAAQRGAAEKQAIGIGCQAGGAFAGGLVAVGQMGATAHSSNEIENLLVPERDGLNDLKNFDSMVGTAAKKEPEVIIGQADPVTGAPAIPDVSDAVKLRARDIMNQDYTASTPETDTALQHLNNKGQLSEVRKDLQAKIADKSRIVNNYELQRQASITHIGTISQLVSSAANGATQAGQAAQTAAGGKEQAAQQVNQTVQSMAGSVAENARQGLGKFYDQIAGLIGAARAGAQAYAQT